MILSTIRNYILLIVISLYFLFNQGFMQLRILSTTGGGIPIGELVLIFSFLTINIPLVLSSFSKNIYITPFAIWWAMGIISALLGVHSYGMWALRDATHVIESLFIIVGFAYASRPVMLELFWQWLPKLLIIVCLYSIGYPFADILTLYSPKILTGAGYSTSLFFNYMGISSLLLMASTYILLFKVRIGRFNIIAIFASVTIVAYTAMLFQARTVYTQLFTLLIFIFIFRRQLLTVGVIGGIVFIIFLIILPIVGLQIKGRLGLTISLEFFINHFLAIFGIVSAGLEGPVSGIDLRLEWWGNIMDRLLSGPTSLLTGLGFGTPLTGFYVAGGVIVREPHNSFISVLGRMGVIGAVSILWIHVLLIKCWYNTYCHFNKLNWEIGKNRLLILMTFFLLIIVGSLGEDILEKPYNAIPYYFFWGIIIRMSDLVKGGFIGPRYE